MTKRYHFRVGDQVRLKKIGRTFGGYEFGHSGVVINVAHPRNRPNGYVRCVLDIKDKPGRTCDSWRLPKELELLEDRP